MILKHIFYKILTIRILRLFQAGNSFYIYCVNCYVAPYLQAFIRTPG